MNDKHIKTANLWNAAGVVVQTRWKHLLPLVTKVETETEFGVGQDFSIPRGSLLHARQAGSSLRETKRDKQIKESMKKNHDYRFPKRVRDKLWIILTKDLGIATREASKLCALNASDYRRVEDVIGGMVDSLWACEPNLFLEGSTDRKIVLKTSRAIFKTAAYNRLILVDMWKEWTNWLKHITARTVLIGASVPPLRPSNVFRRLNRLSVVASLLSKDPSEFSGADLAMIGHLTSTRQMPYLGRPVEKKSLEEFKEVITSETPSFTEISVELNQAIRDVAKRCRRSRGKTPIPNSAVHCSLTCSGEITSGCSKGGQANAVSRDMKDYLLRVQDHEFDEETPFGTVHHKANVPLWKYLFRDGYKFDYEFYKDVEFLDEWMKGGIPIDIEGYFYGLDGVIGRQLLYVAWKMALDSGYPQSPPEIRCSTVAEIGNKARIVTVSHWWLNYLEAPVAHWLIELLRFHPSCFSAFCRQDQAWSFQDLAKRLDPLWGSERRYSVLSSDLKNATNAIPLKLMRFMWQVFLQELGYDLLERPFLNFVIGLISERQVHFPKIDVYARGKLVDHMDADTVIATRGLPMGEALAKPSLTLWALVAEQLAYNRTIAIAKAEYKRFCLDLWKLNPRSSDDHRSRRKYPVRSIDPKTGQFREHYDRKALSFVINDWRDSGLYDVELIIAYLHKSSWRCFHLGGDDHVCIGPVQYLDSVTACFRALGAMLSPAKHGYSNWFIQYCERIVDVRRTNRIRVVDTMKVRLFETGTSTGITRDQRNVAIGKSAQFRKYLEWAPPSDGWSQWKKFQLQCLFISRMGGFMPKPGIPEFYGVFLPPELGGFGLGMESQLLTCIDKVPSHHREMIYRILRDPDNFEQNSALISQLRKMVTNPTARGIEAVGKLEEELVDSINMYPQYFNARTWRDLKSDPELQEEITTPVGRKIDDDNKRFAARLAQKGIVPAREYAKRYTKGSLFREMIMHPEEIKNFNTRPYVRSLQHLKTWWEKNSSKYPEKEGPIIGSVSRILNMQQANWYIDCNEPIEYCMAARIKTPEDWGGGYEPANWEDVPYITGPRILSMEESGRPDLCIGLVFAGLDKVRDPKV